MAEQPTNNRAGFDPPVGPQAEPLQVPSAVPLGTTGSAKKGVKVIVWVMGGVVATLAILAILAVVLLLILLGSVDCWFCD